MLTTFHIFPISASFLSAMARRLFISFEQSLINQWAKIFERLHIFNFLIIYNDVCFIYTAFEVYDFSFFMLNIKLFSLVCFFTDDERCSIPVVVSASNAVSSA